MALAPLIQSNQSSLIRLPNGQLVPLSSIAGALPPAPAAASGGPVQAPDTISAGQSDSALPLAATPATALASVATRAGRGGAANPGAIPTGGADKSQVISAPEGSDDMSGVAALAKALGKNAGSSSAPGSPGNTGAGFMDKVKEFLGLDAQPTDGTTGVKIPPPTPVQTDVLPPLPIAANDTTPGAPMAALDPVMAGNAPAPAAAIPPPVPDKPGLLQRIGSALGINSTPAPAATPPNGPLPAGALPAQAQSTSGGGFLQSILGSAYDAGDPLMQGEQGETMKARYGDSYQSPDWFDRLQANPARLALLTGGLSTMAAASKPGARWAGAVGEGALSGINTVYEKRATERKAALDASKEASEAKLRDAQGAFYGVRGVNDTTRADAASTTADARTTSAQAALQRATTLANGPGKGISATQWKHDIWLQSHPGDEQGALDYAAGHKKMSGAESMRSAYAIANSENNASMQPQDAAWVDRRAAEIADKITGNEGGGGAMPAPGAPGKGGSPNPTPSKNAGALPPKVGTVVSGYTFQGGNPNDPKAWKKN